ncbi:hypothetical protein, conserved [Plasmodium ovale wallikeri]|uniref:Uncharacterized protein n=1 Tax=Plasmodium ovale wallikeri TaxID=864142 RepID=A0A1A8YLV5_PLAOA|nr:hypothetical protein, conserved [Plasmodium ovale wallikeri]SBT32552.1 hypothetical protein, conserved [Plasmodium ovale wallikeri]
MKSVHDLEDVKPEKDEEIVLNDEDFRSKSDVYGSGSSDASSGEGKRQEGEKNDIFLRVDSKKDFFFLHGKEDKITQENYLEKILLKEKKNNKSVSKEIDLLINSYRYANTHPDKFIECFFNDKEKKADFVKTYDQHGDNENVENNRNGHLKEVDDSRNGSNTHMQRPENYGDISKVKDGVEPEFNAMTNTSMALKMWSLKLGLLRESDMHLDNKELINLFLKNKKFRRVLKFYNVNTKDISIPVIYKITKLLYFERPFPRKEQTRKLNMN